VKYVTILPYFPEERANLKIDEELEHH